MSRRSLTNGGCADFQRSLAIGRRGFLTAGGLGVGGLTLTDLLRSEAQAGPRANKDASVLILWMRGGPSHIDMWDPKPDAPAEIRGEFSPLASSVPGIRLTDQLPLSAKLMHKWSIIRSLHHADAGHSTGDQMCFTGYPPGPSPDVNVSPSVGSVVSQKLGHLSPELPAYVMIPRMVPGTNSAYLGPSYKPFETGVDPASEGPFVLSDFALSEGLTIERLNDRQALLAGFDRLRREADQSGRMDALDRFSHQALGMLTSQKARDAFDLDREPRAIRERYGYRPRFSSRVRAGGDCPAWSQRILLGRRLIEAGVRIVTVDCRWWDTHEDNFWSLTNGFLPRWDQAYTALIEDLDQRGLLANTLVVAWGEFGRSPRINAAAGRDHYPNVFSAALAGGPVKGGRVVGSSDAHGAFPKDNPKHPCDVLATIYRHLGIDYDQSFIDFAGRPKSILPYGTPIGELS